MDRSMTKRPESLEEKIKTKKKTFSFNDRQNLEANRWMLELTSLEVLNSVFSLTKQIICIKVYRELKLKN